MYLVVRSYVMIGLCHKCYASGVSVVLDEDTAMTFCTECNNQTTQE